MIVILIEFIALFSLNKKLKDKGLDYSIILFFALSLQFCILAIYRVELLLNDRIVYYSDAEVYWENTLTLLEGKSLSGIQTGYAWYCFVIQITSPVRMVVLNNVSNLLLVDITIYLIAILLQNQNNSIETIKKFITICIFNPLVVYSLLRNLKDSLFIFLAVLIIFSYIKISRKFSVIYIALIGLLTIFITMVRPWGFIISFLLLIEKLLNRKHIFRNLLIIGIVGTGLFTVVLYFGFNKIIDVWMPIVFENGESQSFLGLIMGPFRILTGPGPYRSILGYEYFQFFTYTGNICCAIGCTLWWWELVCLSFNIGKFKFNGISISFGIVWLFFLFIYSMQYGGSLEMRFRGVIYILTTALFLSGFQKGEYDRTATPGKIVFYFILGAIITVISIL